MSTTFSSGSLEPPLPEQAESAPNANRASAIEYLDVICMS
jgi:hypothetical protein